MIDICQWRGVIGHWNCSYGRSYLEKTNERAKETKIQLKPSLYFIIVLSLVFLSILIFITNYPKTSDIVYSEVYGQALFTYTCKLTCNYVVLKWVWSVATIMNDCTIFLSYLCLLLSGDVELNPGPKGNSREILRANCDRLTDAITPNLIRVTNSLYSKGLIQQGTVDEMLVMGVIPDYTKATKLMIELQRQINITPDPDLFLIAICQILINQQHQLLTDIVTSLLHQLLGQSIPAAALTLSIVPTDVQRFSDIMRDSYKHQPIVATDWPPRVGKDFFGRLVLVETQSYIEQNDFAWYMLRGKVDKIPEIPGCEMILVEEDILKPCYLSSLPRVVVDGPPGIGKTTLCRKLCNMWANGKLTHQQYDLVLYCPLRNSKIAQATTLADLCMYKCSEVEAVTKWIEQSHGERLLIIFDGWDELSTELRNSSLAASIIRRDQLIKCSVIVTSRSYASSSLLELESHSKHVQVIGFSEEEIPKVIRGTLQKKDPQLSVKLISDLKARSDVRSLCYIPLVCSMVILIYCKLKGHLPTSLTELYKIFILQTIKRYVKKTNKSFIEPGQVYNLDHLPPVLATPLQEMCQLAYLNLKDNKMTFFLHQLQESLNESIKEDYLGLMTSFSEFDEEIYQFLHLSIQEFLAAWWIVKSDMKTEEVFKEHFDDDHFRLCLRFVAGLTHLKPEENYEEYFTKPFDLQCRASQRPLFGFDTNYRPWFYHENSDSLYYGNHMLFHDYEVLFQYSLHLLYESQNSNLCQVLAKSITNKSMCHHKHCDLVKSQEVFDQISLFYFLSNSNITWNRLHVGMFNESLEAVCCAELTNVYTKSLDISIVRPTNNASMKSLFHKPILHNVQECDFYLSTVSVWQSQGDPLFDPNFSLINLLKLPQLKILRFSSTGFDFTLPSMTKLQKLLENNSTIQEMIIKLAHAEKGNFSNIATSIIKGVTKNKTLTSFTIEIELLDSSHSPSNLPLPDGIIEQLVRDNYTLQALKLNIPNELLPSSLNIVEVNTPLTAVEIKKYVNKHTTIQQSSLVHTTQAALWNQLILSLVTMTKSLSCLTIDFTPCLPSLLFQSHPTLQSLDILTLDTPESVTELFTVLQTNTTLRGLRVGIKKEIFSSTDMCASLRDMLIHNQTLLYLEINMIQIDDLPIPSSYLTFLTNGIMQNTSLQELKIPIPLTIYENVALVTIYENVALVTFFEVISKNKYITELGLVFQTDQITSNDDAKMKFLFFRVVIPKVMNMLLNNTTIKLLWIESGYADSEDMTLEPEYVDDSLHELAYICGIKLYTHPSLKYVRFRVFSLFLDQVVQASKNQAIALRTELEPPRALEIPVVEIA